MHFTNLNIWLPLHLTFIYTTSWNWLRIGQGRNTNIGAFKILFVTIEGYSSMLTVILYKYSFQSCVHIYIMCVLEKWQYAELAWIQSLNPIHNRVSLFSWREVSFEWEEEWWTGSGGSERKKYEFLCPIPTNHYLSQVCSLIKCIFSKFPNGQNVDLQCDGNPWRL